MRPKMIQVTMLGILVQESTAAAAAATVAGWTLALLWCSDKGWCRSRLSSDETQTRSDSGSLDHCGTEIRFEVLAGDGGTFGTFRLTDKSGQRHKRQ